MKNEVFHNRCHIAALLPEWIEDNGESNCTLATRRSLSGAFASLPKHCDQPISETGAHQLTCTGSSVARRTMVCFAYGEN